MDMEPAVARVCFELAGIWMYLDHMRTEKHTMGDLRHYQNVRPRFLMPLLAQSATSAPLVVMRFYLRMATACAR